MPLFSKSSPSPIRLVPRLYAALRAESPGGWVLDVQKSATLEARVSGAPALDLSTLAGDAAPVLAAVERVALQHDTSRRLIVLYGPATCDWAGVFRHHGAERVYGVPAIYARRATGSGTAPPASSSSPRTAGTSTGWRSSPRPTTARHGS